MTERSAIPWVITAVCQELKSDWERSCFRNLEKLRVVCFSSIGPLKCLQRKMLVPGRHCIIRYWAKLLKLGINNVRSSIKCESFKKWI